MDLVNSMHCFNIPSTNLDAPVSFSTCVIEKGEFHRLTTKKASPCQDCPPRTKSWYPQTIMSNKFFLVCASHDNILGSHNEVVIHCLPHRSVETTNTHALIMLQCATETAASWSHATFDSSDCLLPVHPISGSHSLIHHQGGASGGSSNPTRGNVSVMIFNALFSNLH